MEKQEWHQQINALMYRIQQQDKQALQQLYQLAGEKMLTAILCILANKADAEDVLQEVFIKVWQKSGQYTGQGQAWGWLCVTARHSALDRLRSMKVQSQRTVSEEDEDLADTLLQEIDHANTLSLNHCLSTLKEQARKSIVLSYVHGYSHNELADKMSTPLGTIKAWIRRGLQELKLCLQH